MYKNTRPTPNRSESEDCITCTFQPVLSRKHFGIDSEIHFKRICSRSEMEKSNSWPRIIKNALTVICEGILRLEHTQHNCVGVIRFVVRRLQAVPTLVVLALEELLELLELPEQAQQLVLWGDQHQRR